MNKQDIIHTHKFKLFNVEIESEYIELATDSWIEIDPSMAEEMPIHFAHFLGTSMVEDPQWGLIRWFKQLFASNVIIGTKNTEAQIEANPFENHEASYIAIALSILLDSWFVAGIEYHSRNQGEPQPQPSAPYTSTFNGLAGGNSIVQEMDEDTLKLLYDFVYGAFRTSTRDERKIKLLALYSQCLVKTSTQSVAALKLGFSSQFSGQTGTIIYGNLFFEHVFTNESWSEDMKKGVKEWNSFFSNSQVIWEEIKLVHQFRTTLVHDNAVNARVYVDNWKLKYRVSDDELLSEVEKIVVGNIKKIMRSISLNYANYLAFRKSLPVRNK